MREPGDPGVGGADLGAGGVPFSDGLETEGDVGGGARGLFGGI